MSQEQTVGVGLGEWGQTSAAAVFIGQVCTQAPLSGLWYLLA